MSLEQSSLCFRHFQPMYAYKNSNRLGHGFLLSTVQVSSLSNVDCGEGGGCGAVCVCEHVCVCAQREEHIPAKRCA